MPLSLHLRAGIAWYWLFVVLPAILRAGPRARLLPRAVVLDTMLMSDAHTHHITRFTAQEVYGLAADLLINPGAPISRNWRFSPLHRLVLSLIWLSNALPARKHSINMGWAHNAVLNNARYHIDAIIDNLDAPGAGTCTRSSLGLLASLMRQTCRMLTMSMMLACFLPPADRLHGWTLAEQDAWIAAPFGDPLFRNCIGTVDATYIRVQRPKNTALERRMYSVYKKYHAVFFLAIIDRRGEV